MEYLAFKEFARSKLYEYRKSPSQTFLSLDEDRDGIVQLRDIATFLLRYHVKSSFLSTQEMSGWFTDICKGDPQDGISMSEFNLFLYGGVSYETHYIEKSDRLQADIVYELYKALVMYYARLGTDFIGFYKVLTGGQGFLYEHQLRKLFETEGYLTFSDYKWKKVVSILKYNKNLQQVTKEELYDFMRGKIEEIPYSNIIPFSECKDYDFTNYGDAEPLVEEVLQSVPEADSISSDRPEVPVDYEYQDNVKYSKPGEKLLRVRPQKPVTEYAAEYCQQKTEEPQQKVRKSHYHCIPNYPQQQQIKCPLKITSTSPEFINTAGSQARGAKDEKASTYYYCNNYTLSSLPLPQSLDSVYKFHSTAVISSPQMLLQLLGQKFIYSGGARYLFSKFDTYKCNRISFKTFNNQLRELFGIVLTLEQIQSVFAILSKSAKYVDYQLFLKLYDFYRYICEDSPKRYPSQCRMNQKVQQFITSASVLNGLERYKQMASIGGTPQQNAYLSQKLAESGLQELPLYKDDIVSDKLSKDMDFAYRKSLHSQRGVGDKVVEAHYNFDVTTNQLNESPIRRQESRGFNGTYALVNETSAVASKYQQRDQNDFVFKVKQMLDLRGENLKKSLRNTFPDKLELSSSELIWFFRNVVGCSFSPSVILRTFSMCDGMYIDKGQIWEKFNELAPRKKQYK